MTRDTEFPRSAAFLTAGFAACLLTLVNVFLSSFVRIPPFGTVSGHLISVVYLAALLLALLCTARGAARLPVSTAFLLLAGSILSVPILLQILSNVAHLPAWLDILADFLPFSAQIVVSNLLAPLGMTLLGAGIGRIIKHPNTLLAGAGASIFFDIVVVTMGTVARLMQSGSNVIAAVSVGAGVTGASHKTGPHGIPVPVSLPPAVCTVTIGPADVLFMALFLSAVGSLRLSTRATFGWMYGLLLTALVIVETTGMPVPALAPMGVAVLIANVRHAAFTKQERRDLAIGSAFALVCAALMVSFARHAIKPAQKTPDGADSGRIGFAIGPAPATGVAAILNVVPGSRAEAAGLRAGDAVMAVNGRPFGSLPADVRTRMLRDARLTGITLTIKSGDQPKPRDITFPPSVPPSTGLSPVTPPGSPKPSAGTPVSPASPAPSASPR